MKNKSNFVSEETPMTVDDLAIITNKEFSNVQKQFAKIDDRFVDAYKQIDEIRLVMVTKSELNLVYTNMISRFDNLDSRLNRLEERMDYKFDIFMKKMESQNFAISDHETRLTKLEIA